MVIALISLMRDGLLRGNETAALLWSDLSSEPDGSGRLRIRSSKTDQESKGATVYVCEETMVHLAAIRNCAGDEESIFGLTHLQILNRIRVATKQAGLGEGYGAHSPRIGMAIDLARAGIELPALMAAGRWKSPVMPAYYIRNEEAGRGAVARYYGYS